MRTNDIVLTGLPRSGTTLCCHLLNQLPNTVALHEPVKADLVKNWPFPILRALRLGRYFTTCRKTILSKGVARSMQSAGKVPSDHFSDRPDASGKRAPIVSAGKIQIDRPLTPDFRLVIKHPGMFAALLPALVKRFRTVAVVRNPLSILASWNSVRMPAGNGRAPIPESLHPALGKALDRISDSVDRQLYLLDWFFGRFDTFLPDAAILRYEAIVTSGGKSLSVVTPEAASLGQPLENRNANSVYNADSVLRLGERLVASDGSYWRFYTRDSVKDIMNRFAESVSRARKNVA